MLLACQSFLGLFELRWQGKLMEFIAVLGRSGFSLRFWMNLVFGQTTYVSVDSQVWLFTQVSKYRYYRNVSAIVRLSYLRWSSCKNLGQNSSGRNSIQMERPIFLPSTDLAKQLMTLEMSYCITSETTASFLCHFQI